MDCNHFPSCIKTLCMHSTMYYINCMYWACSYTFMSVYQICYPVNSARSEISNDYVLFNGSSQMGSSAMAMYTAVTNYNLRLLSLPPIPAQPPRSVSQPGNRHASGNWSLQGIPARESQGQREDSVSCSQVICLSIPYYIAIDSQHPGKMC